MAKGSSRRRSKKRRPDFSRQTLLWIIILAVAGGLVLGLVLFARQSELPVAQHLPPKPETDSRTPDAGERARDEVEAFLATLDLASHDVRRDLTELPYRYDVQGEYPPRPLVAGLTDRLRHLARELAVSEDVEAKALTVTRRGEPWLRILFHALPAEPPGPQVAIIMDDLGRSLYPGQVLLGMTHPVTFSILPGEPHAAQFAEMVHAAGGEVMLHVPMEPQGFPAVKPGADALMVRDGTSELQDKFRAFLARVPYVVGANNHMGSRFTEDARAMDAVMEIVGERGMFFVDSLTTGRSTVTRVAERFGVPHLARDVFLDNVADVDAITGQIRKLAGRAREHGSAVGICHPYPETLDALRRELPKLAESGVEVVPVSVLIERARRESGKETGRRAGR